MMDKDICLFCGGMAAGMILVIIILSL